MHLGVLGFIGISDFVHLLVYIYGAHTGRGREGHGRGVEAVQRVDAAGVGGAGEGAADGTAAGLHKLGIPPQGCSEEDPRKVAADALGYVTNNRSRMDYPRYRQLGLPVSSAAVESVMKQVNKRMKGTEKFWLEGGAEANLQIRAAYISEDQRANRYWARPGHTLRLSAAASAQAPDLQERNCTRSGVQCYGVTVGLTGTPNSARLVRRRLSAALSEKTVSSQLERPVKHSGMSVVVILPRSCSRLAPSGLDGPCVNAPP